jgi:hypothetical protein
MDTSRKEGDDSIVQHTKRFAELSQAIQYWGGAAALTFLHIATTFLLKGRLSFLAPGSIGKTAGCNGADFREHGAVAL